MYICNEIFTKICSLSLRISSSWVCVSERTATLEFAGKSKSPAVTYRIVFVSRLSPSEQETVIRAFDEFLRTLMNTVVRCVNKGSSESTG